MSVVSAWILNILSVVVLSLLVDIILPDGKSSKFIKGVFGYLIIIVILAPVFNFLTKKEFNLDNVFQTSGTHIQEDYVASIKKQYLSQLENKIAKEIETLGLKNIKIGVVGDIFSEKLTILNVNVDLSEMVISEDSKNINIKTSITDIVLKNIKINKELIVFYE